MFKRVSIILLSAAVLLTACGPQGTPTMAPEDVQNTAVAAAFTMVAMTQAAIPTNTLPPPTETPSPTPLPTFTPLPPPTLDAALILPTATVPPAASDPNSCNKPLNTAEAGRLQPIRIENATGGDINLSLNLYVKNAFGQCGALSYVIKKNGKVLTNIPVGLWYAYAWITKNGKSGGTSSGSFEINQGYLDLIVVKIGPEAVNAH